MSEQWRDIEGYEGYYQVSNFGHVRSMTRVVPSRWGAGCTYHQRLLAPGGGRYLKVTLRRFSIPEYASVHRLVAKAFVLNQADAPQVNHKNGNPKDNRAENLEWCNASENAIHAIRLGLRNDVKGERHGRSKVTEKQAWEIKYGTRTLKEYSEEFGITYSGAYQIRSGVKWKHI